MPDPFMADDRVGGRSGADVFGARRRPVSRRWLLPIAVLAVLLLVAGTMLGARQLTDNEPPGLEFVIPAGASSRIAIPTIDSAIPISTDIRFGPDDTARVTVRNDDSVANRAGPWVIGPGQTYTANFDNAGVYQFECSVDPAESVTVTVET